MIFDTDVLIWALRGHEKAGRVIEDEEKRAVSVVTCMELIQGARDKRELAAIRRFLLNFVTLPLTEDIGYRARIYMEEFALKSSLGLPDALIAATAIEAQDALCTANSRHYKVIRDLEIKPFRPSI